MRPLLSILAMGLLASVVLGQPAQPAGTQPKKEPAARTFYEDDALVASLLKNDPASAVPLLVAASERASAAMKDDPARATKALVEIMDALKEKCEADEPVIHIFDFLETAHEAMSADQWDHCRVYAALAMYGVEKESRAHAILREVRDRPGADQNLRRLAANVLVRHVPGQDPPSDDDFEAATRIAHESGNPDSELTIVLARIAQERDAGRRKSFLAEAQAVAPKASDTFSLLVLTIMSKSDVADSAACSERMAAYLSFTGAKKAPRFEHLRRLTYVWSAVGTIDPALSVRAAKDAAAFAEDKFMGGTVQRELARVVYATALRDNKMAAPAEDDPVDPAIKLDARVFVDMDRPKDGGKAKLGVVVWRSAGPLLGGKAARLPGEKDPDALKLSTAMLGEDDLSERAKGILSGIVDMEELETYSINDPQVAASELFEKWASAEKALAGRREDLVQARLWFYIQFYRFNATCCADQLFAKLESDHGTLSATAWNNLRLIAGMSQVRAGSGHGLDVMRQLADDESAPSGYRLMADYLVLAANPSTEQARRTYEHAKSLATDENERTRMVILLMVALSSKDSATSDSASRDLRELLAKCKDERTKIFVTFMMSANEDESGANKAAALLAERLMALDEGANHHQKVYDLLFATVACSEGNPELALKAASEAEKYSGEHLPGSVEHRTARTFVAKMLGKQHRSEDLKKYADVDPSQKFSVQTNWSHTEEKGMGFVVDIQTAASTEADDE